MSNPESNLDSNSINTESHSILIDSGTSITTSPSRLLPSPRYSNKSQNKSGDENSLIEPLLSPSPYDDEEDEVSPWSALRRDPFLAMDASQTDRLKGGDGLRHRDVLRLEPNSPNNEEEEHEIEFQDEHSIPDENNDANDDHAHRHVPWYQNPYQRMAMISNFGTSYNVVSISLVLPIVEQVLLELPDAETTSTEDSSAVASSLLAGMILGQLVGGALGDSVLGLAGALRVVMIVQIIASLGSACVPTDSHSAEQFYWTLSTWRFVLGVGAGAVYPLAACLSVEQAGMGRGADHHRPTTTSERGNPDATNNSASLAMKRVVRTFAVQGVGFWCVPALALALLHMPQLPLQITWRILLGAGCLPGMVLLVLQWQLYRKEDQEEQQKRQLLLSPSQDNMNPENNMEGDEEGDGLQPQPQSTQQSGGLHHPNDQDEETVGDRELMCEDSDGEVGTFLDSAPDLSSEGCYGDSEPPAIRHGWWASIWMEPNLCQKLLGTAVTWFLFDVLFYGNTLFQPIVVEAAFGPKQDNSDADDPTADRHLLQRTALDSFLLTSIALPGYAVAGWLMGKKTCGITQSARYVMLQGFACMSILYLTIGLFWNELRHYPIALVLLYGMTFFFANYGPNTTTFILPSLVYSLECRSTFNGVSAAAGKLGALTGATLFAPAANTFGDATVMYICAAIGFVAYGMTVCFVRVPKPTTSPSTRVLATPPQPSSASLAATAHQDNTTPLSNPAPETPVSGDYHDNPY